MLINIVVYTAIYIERELCFEALLFNYSGGGRNQYQSSYENNNYYRGDNTRRNYKHSKQKKQPRRKTREKKKLQRSEAKDMGEMGSRDQRPTKGGSSMVGNLRHGRGSGEGIRRSRTSIQRE